VSERTLKENLARFMDPQAFAPVAAPTKRTSPEFAHRQAEKRKVRREIAMKRAEAAIRFFCKPDNLCLINERAVRFPAASDAKPPASAQPAPAIEARGGTGVRP